VAAVAASSIVWMDGVGLCGTFGFLLLLCSLVPSYTPLVTFLLDEATIE